MGVMRHPQFALPILAVAALALSYHAVVADTLFSRKVTLSPGHLQLLWSPGQEYLMLKVEVKTRGYFALTFGNVHEDPNDTQDALLGWTDDAEVLLQVWKITINIKYIFSEVKTKYLFFYSRMPLFKRTENY
jgi:hypothetical protein